MTQDTVPTLDTMEVVAFFVGDMLCAIECNSIREILNTEKITFVYHAPSFIKGVVNIRGQIVTIIDVKEKLQIPPGTVKRKPRIIVTLFKGESIGMLVDSVEDIIVGNKDNLSTPPSHLDETKGTYVKKILKTEDHLVSVLNIEKILDLKDLT